MLLAGPASPQPGASPVMRVDFRVTAVGGKRPPNIVETRVAGAGSFSFNESPFVAQPTLADSASGKVVVEYDVLTPHPQTIRVTLKLTGVQWLVDEDDNSGASLYVEVVKAVDGDGDTLAACPTRAKDVVHIVEAASVAYQVVLSSCKIRFGQSAKPTANSRVHVAIVGKCLRTTASRKPLCGKKPAAKSCKLAGTWSDTTETVGSTTWTTSADGKAQESGLGNATGHATLAGSLLTITWTTADGWGGVYRWTLDKTCSGKGTLSFTKGPRSGDVVNSTVRGSPS